MVASSTEGRGKGSSGKLTAGSLAGLATGPQILVTGIAAAENGVTSPPSANGEVILPRPLEGGADKYVVLLTSLSAGLGYVTDKAEDASGNFTGFSFVTAGEGEVMYLVAKVGVRLS
jgi:hypothetical protein